MPRALSQRASQKPSRPASKATATRSILRPIPCSRHDPKIAGSDDAEVVGDRITHCRPIARNVFAQEAERRIGELGDGCVAFVVGDVSVHDAPESLDRIEMWAVAWSEMQPDAATWPFQPFLHQLGM